ncbi:MAG: hypothetical protein JW999_07435 [Methanotrichaceae archaeon]|nr:hypothetical protein [Methanotrichaceae archaeon]
MKSILSEENVRAVFTSCDKECDALIALFKMAISNWDQVEYILEGKPHIGAEGWHAVYDLFCKFNEEHPGESVFPGGLWLSMGFLKDESLDAWEVDCSEMKFAFKNERSKS